MQQEAALTSSTVSVGIDSQRVEFGDHLQVRFCQLPVAVLGSLLICRCIVPGLLYQLGHFIVCTCSVVPKEMNPCKALMRSGVANL